MTLTVNELLAEVKRLREAIAGPEAWLDSWAQHVGNCQGGYVCTCGLTRARSELSAVRAIEAGAHKGGDDVAADT